MTKIYDKASDYVPEPMRNYIIECVEGGVKGVQLVSWVSTALHENILINVKPQEKDAFSCQVPVKRFTRCDPIDLIELMVKEGEIVELEYSLPDSNYRIKSMFFPKGTVFYQNKNIKKD